MWKAVLSAGFDRARGGGVECHAAACSKVVKYCVASSNSAHSLMRRRRLMCSSMQA